MLFPIKVQDLSKCRYNSAFGSRIHPITKIPTKHRGIDIAMPTGTPLVAIDSGVILYNQNNPTGYGYYVVIKHDSGLYSLYAHLNKLSHFKVGQRVKKGEIFAYSGNTGSSTGPHLHFEIHEGNHLFPAQVKNKDTAVDPVKYYPSLAGFFNQNLANFKINNNGNKGDDIVEFKEKWQEDLLITTIQSLGKKQTLNNADDWIKKFKDGKMTTSELGLIALVAADRK